MANVTANISANIAANIAANNTAAGLHSQLPFRLPSRGLLLVLLAMGVLVVGFGGVPTLLPIDSVQVYGELHWVGRDTLTESINPYLNTSFFSADLNGIKQAVESLPWVASASVRRKWPNQLQVVVSEQHAIARWKDSFLINEQGRLFRPGEIPQELSQSLVLLQGPDSAYDYLYAQYSELQPLFAGIELSGSGHNPSSAGGRDVKELVITKMILNDRRALSMELSNGIRINFGRVTASMDLYNAAERFINAYQSGLKEQAGKISVVDLRYTNGFAVRWKDNSSDKNQKIGNKG